MDGTQVNQLHTEIEQLFQNGDRAGVVSKIIGVDGGVSTAEEMLGCGLFLRDRGWSSEAIAAFERGIEIHPDYIPSYYEAAFIHRINGRHLEAARLLLVANQKNPQDRRTENFLLHMLHAIGANTKALEVTQSDHRLSKELMPEDLLPAEFGQFLREYPYGEAMLLLDTVVSRNNYLSTQAVYERVMKALDAKEPFSLIRMGDGEGCCLRLSFEDELRYKRLYAAARLELEAMWFGPDFDTTKTGFRSLLEGFPAVITDSDIVGIPYQSWLEHEYRISSLRGVPTLVNILRFVRNLDKPQTLCSQQIHLDLHNGGYMEKIIRHAQDVSVISCLAELPGLLTSRFGLSSVDFYKIPGEKGSSAALGQDAVTGVHFPEAFVEICTRLERPHRGRLFLIAGGILGKFYADVIRRNGGVALDIGSLADGWAMKKTRPGMDASVAL